MDISMNYLAGASIIKIKPIFSNNGENIFVASKNTVNQYNTTTGKLIYQYDGWEENILNINVKIIDNLECLVACCVNGKIMVWKISNQFKLLEINIPKKKLKGFQLIKASLVNGFDVLIVYKAKKNRLIFSTLNTKKLDKQYAILKIPRKNWAIDVSSNAPYFSVVCENYIHFISLKTYIVSSYKLADDTRIFTCISCHPNEEIVLSGDDSGRIVCWQNLFSKQTQAVFHWHTLPVKSIVFSQLGSYFYSGADEAVLVKWQLNNNSNEKHFLPRLPGGIAQLTVANNGQFLAVATTDNAIRILNTQFEEITLIQHIALTNSKRFDCGINYDQFRRAIILNGYIGCVQFYSINNMELLYNVNIVNQNKLTAERTCKLENTDVRKVAISKNSEWLATVEDRKNDENMLREIRLKFWFFSQEIQNFKLNTQIEFPHEDSVNAMEFQHSQKLVTVSDDRSFKLWELHNSTWKLQNIGTFRNYPCKALSFSMDGSLFAIGFHSILSIWNSDNCQLKTTLVHSKFSDKIKKIQFGQGNQCPFIVALSGSNLICWNILTLTVKWMVPLNNINILIADKLSTFMMAISTRKNGQKVYIFEPSSSNLLFFKEFNLNNKIMAATFLPTIQNNDKRLLWHERVNICFVTSNGELHYLGKTKEDLTELKLSEDLTTNNNGLSLFSKLRPKIARNETTEEIKHHQFAKKNDFNQYLEAPTETLPLVSWLATSFMENIVLQREY